MSSRSDSERKPPVHPRRRALKWTLGVFAGVVIVCAVLVGLFRVAANLVPRYHEEIQRQIATQLGADVSIGPVSLVWHGWGPALVFRDVRVHGAGEGRAVISAESLRLDFSLLALLHGQAARPSAFHVERPRVTLRQLPDGRFVVPGIKPPAGSGPSPLKGMLGDGVSVHDGRLRVEFTGKRAGVWTLDKLDLVIGSGLRHRVNLGVTLPAPLGGHRLQLAGHVQTPGPQFAKWHWRARLVLDGLELAGADRFLPAGIPRVTGTLAVSGQAHGTGLQPAGASGRLRIERLAAARGRLEHVETRFEYAAGDRRVLTLEDTRLAHGSHLWQPGRVQAARDPSGRLHFFVHDLRFDLLPVLANFLPSSHAALETRLAAMQPSGRAEDLSAAFTPGKTEFDLQGTLRDVSVRHVGDLPGFRHLSARLDIHGGVGRAMLDAPGLTLLMPRLFGHPVSLDTARGTVIVAVTGDGVQIGMPRLALTGPALAGALEGLIDIPRTGSARIRLAAYVLGADAVRARSHYLPHGLLPASLDDWLMHSFSGGRITDARLYFDGPVKGFPYRHGGGYFGVNFGYRGVSLSPGWGWAPMHALSGRVHFENAGMRATITKGEISGAHVVTGSAAIPDFFDLHLKVHADVAGNAEDFLDFLRNSPISRQLGGALDSLHAQGPTRTRLELSLPIMHPNRFRIDGHLYMNGVTAHYGGLPFALEDMRGKDAFDGKGPLKGRFTARLKGAPVILRLGRSKSGDAVKATLKGKLPAAAVASTVHLPPDKYLAGSLPLDLVLTVPLRHGEPPISLDMDSSLEGLAIKLPAPLGKPATAAVPVAAHLDIRGHRLFVGAHYGAVLAGCGEIDARTNVPAIRGLHLVLGTGTACREAVSGLLVTGGWPELELGPWLKLLPKDVFSGKGAIGAAPQFDRLGFNVRFGKLKLLQQQFAEEQVSGRMGPERLEIGFRGKDLAGKAMIPRRASNADPIVADISHGTFKVRHGKRVVATPPEATGAVPAATSPTAVSVAGLARPGATAAAAGTVAQAAPASATGGTPLRPQDFPPMVLHVGHMAFGGADFDNVLVRVKRLDSGVAFDPVRVGGGTLDFNGTLVWIKPPGTNGHGQGALKFLAHVHDLGKLLEAGGLGPVATGHGAVTAAIAWSEQSAAGASFTDQLLGKLSMDLRDGQISRVSPGAGRLLSLLNLANVPRYLTFNFNNLTGKGFPFSRIYGDYNIDRGIAKTKGLIIDSSVAWIKLTGSLNLDNQTLDQHALIEPNYTGSLPVIGALVGGLGVGAAVFAITKIFGGVIAQASQLNYSITGPFSNPKVVPAKGSAAPPPATGAAASGQGDTR